jgi:histidine triad (HIT) family protein
MTPGGGAGGGGGACIFCKIVAGEIPATIVKRADGMLAFKDVSPQAPTHLLVIPTTHIGSLNDAKDTASLGKLLAFARDVAQEAGISTKGYRVVLNTNPDGGQTVFHLHLHVLGGRPMHWPRVEVS